MGKLYESRDGYYTMWELYNIHNGKVIITEDLQEDSPKVFKEAFEYCGLNFLEMKYYNTSQNTGFLKDEEA